MDFMRFREFNGSAYMIFFFFKKIHDINQSSLVELVWNDPYTLPYTAQIRKQFKVSVNTFDALGIIENVL